MKRLITGLFVLIDAFKRWLLVELTILDHQYASRAMLLATPHCMCMGPLDYPGLIHQANSQTTNTSYWATHTHADDLYQVDSRRSQPPGTSCRADTVGPQGTPYSPDSEEANQTPWMTSCA